VRNSLRVDVFGAIPDSEGGRIRDAPPVVPRSAGVRLKTGTAETARMPPGRDVGVVRR
jgi:hypothetical protein